MPSGCDEVQTDMDARVVITMQGALDLQLFLKIGLELSVDELHNRLVATNGNQCRVMTLTLKGWHVDISSTTNCSSLFEQHQFERNSLTQVTNLYTSALNSRIPTATQQRKATSVITQKAALHECQPYMELHKL